MERALSVDYIDGDRFPVSGLPFRCAMLNLQDIRTALRSSRGDRPACNRQQRGRLLARMVQLAVILHNGRALSLLAPRDPAAGIKGVTAVIAERQPSAEFSQIARLNWLTAKHAKGLRARRPAVHQDEPHVACPNAKQHHATVWLKNGLSSSQPAEPLMVSLPAYSEPVDAPLRAERPPPAVVTNESKLSAADGAAARCSVNGISGAISHSGLLEASRGQFS